MIHVRKTNSHPFGLLRICRNCATKIEVDGVVSFAEDMSQVSDERVDYNVSGELSGSRNSRWLRIYGAS